MKLNARVDAAVARLKKLGLDFVPIQAPPWVPELERRAGGDLPGAYRSLITRYRFPPFTIGPVDLFGNEGQAGRQDILQASFNDPIIAAWMPKNGYFQIGRPSDDCYDPIAVRLADRGPTRDPAAVARFCHECILMELPEVDLVDCWPSFFDLLDDER